MDILKEEDFEVNVSDEGDYWETRDLKALGKSINEYTSLISSVFGSLQSFAEQNDMTIEAPIETSKNYIKVDED